MPNDRAWSEAPDPHPEHRPAHHPAQPAAGPADENASAAKRTTDAAAETDGAGASTPSLSPPQPDTDTSSRGVAIGIAAVLGVSLVALAVFFGLQLFPGTTSTENDASTGEQALEQTTHSTDQPVTMTATSTAPPSSQTTSPSPPPASTSPSPTSLTRGERSRNLVYSRGETLADTPDYAPFSMSYQGFRDQPGAHCHVDDIWWYAGLADEGQFVICVSNASGGLYYRGHFYGQNYEADVTAEAPAQDYFYIDGTPSSIEIDGAQLRIYTGQTVEDVIELYATFAWPYSTL